MGMTENEKNDFKKFFVEGGEDGFNPEWNKMVINKTIEKHERAIRNRMKLRKESVEERADAMSYYLMYLAKHGTQTADKYFGRRELARLAGENIRDRIKEKALGLKNE